MNKIKFKFNVDIEVKLTEEDIDDIMCSALEGGISGTGATVQRSWAVSISVNTQASRFLAADH